jgi:hypothetical protein
MQIGVDASRPDPDKGSTARIQNFQGLGRVVAQ